MGLAAVAVFVGNFFFAILMGMEIMADEAWQAVLFMLSTLGAGITGLVITRMVAKARGY